MQNKYLELNYVEIGYLMAILMTDKELWKRIEKEMPELFAKLGILLLDAYANSPDHPWQKEAIEETKHLKGKLKLLKLQKQVNQQSP